MTMAATKRARVDRAMVKEIRVVGNEEGEGDSCNKGGLMGIGRRPTDDKAEIVSGVICLRFKFNFL